MKEEMEDVQTLEKINEVCEYMMQHASFNLVPEELQEDLKQDIALWVLVKLRQNPELSSHELFVKIQPCRHVKRWLQKNRFANTCLNCNRYKIAAMSNKAFIEEEEKLMMDEFNDSVERTNCLSDSQKEVIKLKACHQLTISEIARLKNVSITRIRTLYNEGLYRLRNHIVIMSIFE